MFLRIIPIVSAEKYNQQKTKNYGGENQTIKGIWLRRKWKMLEVHAIKTGHQSWHH